MTKVVIGQTIVDEKAITGTRDPDNYYCTPSKLVEAAGRLIEDHMSSSKIAALDVGAGTGAWASLGKYFSLLYGVEKNRDRFGVELAKQINVDMYEPGYTNLFYGDFLELDGRYDAIIGNPPYKRKLTMQIVEHAIDCADDMVMFLLPTNFRHSEERFKQLFKAGRMPAYVYDLAQRPSFTGTGSYPGEYAIFIWKINRLPCYKYEGRMLVWR